MGQFGTYIYGRSGRYRATADIRYTNGYRPKFEIWSYFLTRVRNGYPVYTAGISGTHVKVSRIFTERGYDSLQ